MFAYCENAACKVILFVITSTRLTHCPGCGRFGRLKDVLEEEVETYLPGEDEDRTP